jgi:hypothetical protein
MTAPFPPTAPRRRRARRPPSRHFAIRIVLEFPKLLFCRGADLTRRRYLAASFRRTARSYRRPRSPPTEIRGDELHREAQEG